MILVKKLAFAPFFIIFFGLLIYQINPLIKSYDFIFSLSINSLISLTFLSTLILLTSFAFVLFASLALNWKIVFPVGILASLFPIIFLNQAQGLVFAVGIFVSLLVTNISLENTMKTYLTFHPSSLLGPSIKHLSSLLIVVICITYFLSLNKVIQENGFQIPDSLVETVLKLNPQPQEIPLNLGENFIKQAVQDQIQNFLKPYMGFVPALLAILLFFTLQSLTSIINLLIHPLLWLIFLMLEKSAFISFTTEMRPVKKMVL